MRLKDFKVFAHIHTPFVHNKNIFSYLEHTQDLQIVTGDVYADRDSAYALSRDNSSSDSCSDEIFLLEMNLIEVLADMEVRGVYIDTDRLEDLGSQMQQELARLQRKIYSQSPEDFNLNSSRQLQVILFEKMGIKPIKKTKTGWSVDEKTLSTLAVDHMICADLLVYRHVSKLYSTYVQGLLRSVHTPTGRIHTTFSSLGTSTGRMSSDSPNLQNIPSGDPYANIIKACFEPQESDWSFVVADYSQVELRILASLSGDKNLLKAFHEGIDIHQMTAESLFPDEEIDSKKRGIAKAVNFGVMYGITAFGLSKMLDISTKEAQKYIDVFYVKYPQTATYFESVLGGARENGYVQTFFHRKRNLPNINDANKMARQGAEREAINMPIQGTSADIIKYAMCRIAHWIQENNLKAHMVIQVHDELVFEVHNSQKMLLEEGVTRIMESIVDWEIPLIVNVHSGSNWLEAK